MGFPTWTLWGMGVSAFGALVAIILAYLAQSPRLLSRLNLVGQRLDLRAKSFTGYGLALLLLSMGFFMAGVPLDRDRSGSLTETTTTPEVVAAAGTSAAEDNPAQDEAAGGQSGAMVGLPTSSPGGASGAMAGLITPQPTLDPGAIITATLDAGEVPLPPGTGTEPPATAAATATRAPTVTPTPEPSPTPSPTPILEPTARIGENTSTLPVRRLPGGPVLVVLMRGDTVIPQAGHSFYGGEVWREIQTVSGVIGWVQEQFLDYGESGEG
ncbi:MAG: hypothetical protein KJ046_12470 [Anaerolineae bacterium]|nr:hypothetical protein [Anaerolineae bacterium]RIK19789.1 MAG: hypothetical protein DCC51_08405 [Anaerolineae bacterium]